MKVEFPRVGDETDLGRVVKVTFQRLTDKEVPRKDQHFRMVVEIEPIEESSVELHPMWWVPNG